MGGQVQLFFGTTASTIQLIRAGKLRALAVTTATRSDGAAGRSDGGRVRAGLRGELVVRHRRARGTRRPRSSTRLNKEINAGLADPKIKARLDDMGGTVARPARRPSSAS